MNINRKTNNIFINMRNCIFIFIIILSSTLNAQKPIEIELWPNGAPNDNGIEKEEKIDETRPKNVKEAKLYVFPAKKSNGMAVIACPGGGYSHLALYHEGIYMADWFNSMGITLAVLRYRTPNGNCEVPLSDAHQAIKIMRERAEELNFTKLGIMGASAGGHLASTVATHFDDKTKVDFQILFYPVILMDNYEHAGLVKNLLGNSPDDSLVDMFSNEKHVTSETPPAFIMHSSDDKIVPVENSIKYYMSLVKYGISASLHIYPIGGHGWGFNDSFIFKRQWTGELEKWLREINR